MSKNAIKISLILIITVSFLTLALSWHKNNNASESPNLIMSENHINSDLNMAYEDCASILSFENGISEASLNLKKIEAESEDGLIATIEGNMPKASKVSLNAINDDEALTLAKNFNPNLTEKNIVFAKDISINVENGNYEPEDYNEKVSVDISNLDIDTNKSYVVLHIKDDGSYETLNINEINNNQIKFDTISFSTYILISVDSYNITFSGDNNFKIKSDAGIEYNTNDIFTGSNDFRFIIEPSKGYAVVDLKVQNESGVDRSNFIEIDGSSIAKDCYLNNITENLIIYVETALAPNILTSFTDTKVSVGENATFKIEAENVTGFEWQYKVSGENYWKDAREIGEVSKNGGLSELVIKNVTEKINGYSIRCLLENDKCKNDNRVISDEALVIVYDEIVNLKVVYDISIKSMITEWTITEDNTTITLPVYGEDLNIEIGWGDGTYSSDVTTEFPTHTYEKAGIYNISVTGTCPYWGQSILIEENEDGEVVIPEDDFSTYRKYLTGLIQWGELETTNYGFSYCENLEYVNGKTTENTFINVTNMNNMFVKCEKLNTIDLSEFNTTNVLEMKNVFYGCKNLQELNLTSFDTTQVTSMEGMFRDCSSIAALNISNFNTANLINMSYMFDGCSALVNLNMNNSNTSKVTNMEALFRGCSSIKTLDVDKFNTSKVTNMNYMFENCQNIINLNLENFDTINLVTMKGMFKNCSALNYLNVTTFNTTSVTDMSELFYNCSSLNRLELNNFITSNVKDFSYMFKDCTNLYEINVIKFDTTNATNMEGMFENCQNITELNLENFDTSKVTNMNLMLNGASSLESILVSNKFIVPELSTNMLQNTTTLNAIIITSSNTNRNQFGALKDQLTDKIIYVQNESLDEFRSEFSVDIPNEKVQPILKLIGEERVNVFIGNKYEEEYYEVAGFSLNELNKYMVYGYNIEISGDVNTNVINEYPLVYTLSRTHVDLSGNTIEELNVVERIVNVFDKTIITLYYENGEKYDGNWTNGKVIGLVELLNTDSTWVAIKAGNSEWTQNPAYANIENSGDIMKITFEESMGEFIYIYVREIDASGRATTYETKGDIIKIDKETPNINNLSYKTIDGKLNIIASVKDAPSGIEEYNITRSSAIPSKYIKYTSGEIIYEVSTSGKYYLTVKDKAGNMASGEILAVKDVEVPKGLIEIESTNILSGDSYEDIIVVEPNKISGDKYVNKDVVKIKIFVTDNETKQENIKIALYEESEYIKVKEQGQEIDWMPYKSEVEWTLKDEQGENVVYVIFKDEAGNISMTEGIVDRLERLRVAYAVYSADDNSLRFYRTVDKITPGETYDGRTATAVYTGIEKDVYASATDVPWYNYRNIITQVEIVDRINPISTAYWFNEFTNTSKIAKVENINTKNVTDMKYMFYNCGYNTSTWEVENIGLWNTSKVKSMESMFQFAGYKAAEFVLDLSMWNTSSVEDMTGMFFSAGMNATTWSIGDISSWNTKNVKLMTAMFGGAAYKAKEINLGDIGSWNTESLEDTSYMFNALGYNAESISLDLNGWYTKNVVDMSYMFSNVAYNSKTFSLNIGSWDTSNVTNVTFMFNCAGYNAEPFSLDLSSWNTRNVKTVSKVFYDMRKLKEITVGNNFTLGSLIAQPNSTHIPGADGNWYDKETGAEYTTIPNYKAGTYVAVDPKIAITFNANGGTITESSSEKQLKK